MTTTQNGARTRKAIETMTTTEIYQAWILWSDDYPHRGLLLRDSALAVVRGEVDLGDYATLDELRAVVRECENVIGKRLGQDARIAWEGADWLLTRGELMRDSADAEAR